MKDLARIRADNKFFADREERQGLENIFRAMRLKRDFPFWSNIILAELYVKALDREALERTVSHAR